MATLPPHLLKKLADAASEEFLAAWGFSPNQVRGYSNGNAGGNYIETGWSSQDLHIANSSESPSDMIEYMIRPMMQKLAAAVPTDVIFESVGKKNSDEFVEVVHEGLTLQASCFYKIDLDTYVLRFGVHYSPA